MPYEDETELDHVGIPPPGSESGRKHTASGDQHVLGGISRATALFDFLREGMVRMKKTNAPVDRIKMGLGIALVAVLTGCVGYVDGGYGGAVVVAEPDVYVFGGGYYGGGYYERGRDVRVYSQRGFESRAVAHPGGPGPGRR